MRRTILMLMLIYSNAQAVYLDTGPGGLLNPYIYGYDLPSLPVSQDYLSHQCRLNHPFQKVLVTRPNREPYTYSCHNTHRERAAANDVYFFMLELKQFFKIWYNLDINLNYKGMIARVGGQMANAYWDPVDKTAHFGLGNQDYYPMVAPEIVAHEFAHGLVDLANYGEAGSMAESFADMTGVTFVNYLALKYPHLFKQTWTVGSTVSKNQRPIRYLDNPSYDGESASCIIKHPGCEIAYQDVVNTAVRKFPDNKMRQESYITHKAAGIGNQLFYQLSQAWGVRTAYQVFLRASQEGYWPRYGKFKDYIQGVALVARLMNLDVSAI